MIKEGGDDGENGEEGEELGRKLLHEWDEIENESNVVIVEREAVDNDGILMKLANKIVRRYL